MAAKKQSTRTEVTLRNGKIVKLRRGMNSTSLGLTIHNPKKIENLNAPSKSADLIYHNSEGKTDQYSFIIPKDSTIKITFLNSGHSQVLCYGGANLVKLTKYATWARNKFRS